MLPQRALLAADDVTEPSEACVSLPQQAPLATRGAASFRCRRCVRLSRATCLRTLYSNSTPHRELHCYVTLRAMRHDESEAKPPQRASCRRHTIDARRKSILGFAKLLVPQTRAALAAQDERGAELGAQISPRRPAARVARQKSLAPLVGAPCLRRAFVRASFAAETYLRERQVSCHCVCGKSNHEAGHSRKLVVGVQTRATQRNAAQRNATRASKHLTHLTRRFVFSF